MFLSKVVKSGTILSNASKSSSVFVRLYCKKKNTKTEIRITEKQNDKDKKSKTISVNNIFDKKQYLESSESEIPIKIEEKSENIESDKNNKDVILTTERGKDAKLRSRLSKEYDNLLKKKIGLPSTGLNLSVTIEQEKPQYEIIPPVTIPKIKRDIEKQPFLPEIDIKIGPEPPSIERPVRQEPGKVLLGFIPEEWMQFFIPKTGITGFYTFMFTFGTFLVSKEIYVLEHEFYNGLAVVATWWGLVKWAGPHVASYLDREVDEYENMFKKGREHDKNQLIEAIEEEGLAQYQQEGNVFLMDAKRENIALQLEEEFRKRQMIVYEEVKKRLDYHVELGQIYRRIHHKNLLEYVYKEVEKSITPDLHSKLINYGINMLVAELEKQDKKK